ncbi:hypothetical protein IGI37_002425 [Enterococcus sp. AZ194]|uniref:MerR family transcriptional regulator n=1 Tax=Enterococcus sp. AZ194 TaxID=2774629 RepID=UPI003F264CCB
MKISQVSQELNLPISTLHYYEKVHLIQPKRTIGNYRSYSELDKTKIKYIILLKEFGLSIDEIRDTLLRFFQDSYTQECIAEARQLFDGKTQMMKKKIERYQIMIKLVESLPVFMEQSDDKIRQETQQMVDFLYEQKGEGSTIYE